MSSRAGRSVSVCHSVGRLDEWGAPDHIGVAIPATVSIRRRLRRIMRAERFGATASIRGRPPGREPGGHSDVLGRDVRGHAFKSTRDRGVMMLDRTRSERYPGVSRLSGRRAWGTVRHPDLTTGQQSKETTPCER